MCTKFNQSICNRTWMKHKYSFHTLHSAVRTRVALICSACIILPIWHHHLHPLYKSYRISGGLNLCSTFINAAIVLYLWSSCGVTTLHYFMLVQCWAKIYGQTCTCDVQNNFLCKIYCTDWQRERGIMESIIFMHQDPRKGWVLEASLRLV